MSKRTGVLRNVINSFFKSKQTKTLVGTDDRGNKYYERPADKTHNLRGARWVEPLNTDTVPDVPTAWDAWLRNKRFSPPTQEEIDKNMMTMLRTQARAKELEEKEQLEKYQEDEERKKVEANLGDFMNNVTRETGKREFPKYDDLTSNPGGFKDRNDR